MNPKNGVVGSGNGMGIGTRSPAEVNGKQSEIGDDLEEEDDEDDEEDGKTTNPMNRQRSSSLPVNNYKGPLSNGTNSTTSMTQTRRRTPFGTRSNRSTPGTFNRSLPGTPTSANTLIDSVEELQEPDSGEMMSPLEMIRSGGIGEGGDGETTNGRPRVIRTLSGGSLRGAGTRRSTISSGTSVGLSRGLVRKASVGGAGLLRRLGLSRSGSGTNLVEEETVVGVEAGNGTHKGTVRELGGQGMVQTEGRGTGISTQV